jgi:dihydroxyacid dehydratase/phosphogluconate dehydratase
VDADGVYRKEGPAKFFPSERAAITAIKQNRVQAGDVMVVAGIGPMGTGMEETYQLTSALKHLPFGKQVALVTDARFSGVSTGACIGHVGPEALAGGPIGKVRDGDVIRIVVDRNAGTGSLDLVGETGRKFSAEEGVAVLAGRTTREELQPHAALPDDTRLWAALQRVGGGTWGGCVYDVPSIVAALEAGMATRGK